MSYSLTYFDARGAAEPTRVLFALAGVPFNDNRLQFPEFGNLKVKLFRVLERYLSILCSGVRDFRN